MFERRQSAVDEMMSENIEFRRLFKRHQELDQKVNEAEGRGDPLDDLELTQLKKEKLWAKDRLTWLMDHRETDRREAVS